MNGISQAAVTKGVWLLTTGLNEGVSKLIGQSVRRYRLLNKKSSNPTIIGLTSWGTVTKHTRKVLTWQTSRNIEYTTLTDFAGKRAPTALNYDEKKTLDKHHSHFILLDNGRLGGYIDDNPRSDFVKKVQHECECRAITIIVEGGLNTLQVIKNDLKAKRPVIIIHGSGRLANVLGALLEASSKETKPTYKESLEDDVKKLLELDSHKHWFKSGENENINEEELIKSILELFEPIYREYLSVFCLERDPSLTDVIFKVVDAIQGDAEQQKNFFKLAISWNYTDRTESMPKCLEDDPTLYPSLFELALKENRPVFVDYFLRRNYNPFETTEFVKRSENLKKKRNSSNEFNSDQKRIQSEQESTENNKNSLNTQQVECAIKFIIKELYEKVETHFNRWSNPKTLEALDSNYTQLIGPFASSFYFEQNRRNQFLQDTKVFFYHGRTDKMNETSSKDNSIEKSRISYTCSKPFSSQHMLRELFLWSVYVGYADIAFVLLLQIESRMSAALIAAGMAQHLSLSASTLDVRHTYTEQAKKYEVYATDCINACYQHDERLACQLLLRENPLFGNVTCMQENTILSYGFYLERLCKTPEMDAQGTEFENAATYNYARQLVEDNYRPKVEQETSKLDAQLNSMKNTIDKLQVQIDSLNRSNEQVRAETNAQTYRMVTSMNWMMTAMARVRISNIPVPTFDNSTDSNA
ncbi:unnamed protein product [Rotaria sordida]|uniref:TRPM SLOG domain-containing protein n=2 Tax=Rotaria sordida TaxID=392033 RepID=A0A819TA19_9BILA|nr:unnamed protein product [Rotaria sordida]CAF4116739.1 unnamed protein product [Rotaria sordida]